jgi:hypothetical protein
MGGLLVQSHTCAPLTWSCIYCGGTQSPCAHVVQCPESFWTQPGYQPSLQLLNLLSCPKTAPEQFPECLHGQHVKLGPMKTTCGLQVLWVVTVYVC